MVQGKITKNAAQKSYMKCIELLQLAKSWSNFMISYALDKTLSNPPLLHQKA